MKEHCSSPDEGQSTSSCCFKRAALALHEADYLLVLAGAGMSADSGLGTYETMPSRYREFCDPAKLATESTAEEFQTFWKDFALQYASTEPHEGYSILDNWCYGKKLRRLSAILKGNNDVDRFRDKKWWVYTSNVDGHFRRFPSFRYSNNVCEIHGCAGEFRCSCGMGYYDREKYAEWGICGKLGTMVSKE